MARMYSRKKGKSGSTKPVKRTKPVWLRYSPKETEQLVLKLARAGKTSSEVGMILRDSYGIPDVKLITKKKISKVLRDNKLSSKLPEPLTALIKKDIVLMKHNEANKKDKAALRGSQLTESKIRRLTKYYKRVGQLPQTWNYNKKDAKLLIE